MRAQALGISGVNFCPCIRFCELNFVWALGFRQLLTKKCAIFDRKVTKVTYLLKISNFCTLKFFAQALVFLGKFCLA